MTRGRAATPDPFDLSAVSGSDELFDTLSTRRPWEFDDDPAAHLLAALAADVDVGAPPLPPRVTCTGGTRRRSAAAILTFSVAVTILTSAGAAVAVGVGVGVGGDSGGHRAERARPSISERSNMNAQRESVTGLDESPRDPSTDNAPHDAVIPVSRTRPPSPEDHAAPPTPAPGQPPCPSPLPDDNHKPFDDNRHTSDENPPPACQPGTPSGGHDENRPGTGCRPPTGHQPGKTTYRPDAYSDDHCEDSPTGSR